VGGGIAVHNALKKGSRDKYGRMLRRGKARLTGSSAMRVSTVEVRFRPFDAPLPSTVAARQSALELLGRALSGPAYNLDGFTPSVAEHAARRVDGLFVELNSEEYVATDASACKAMMLRAEALAVSLSGFAVTSNVADSAPAAAAGGDDDDDAAAPSRFGRLKGFGKKKKKKKASESAVVLPRATATAAPKETPECGPTGPPPAPEPRVVSAGGTRYQMSATTFFEPQIGSTVYFYKRFDRNIVMQTGTVCFFPTTEANQSLVQNGCLNIKLKQGGFVRDLIAGQTYDLLGERTALMPIRVEKLSLRPFVNPSIDCGHAHTQEWHLSGTTVSAVNAASEVTVVVNAAAAFAAAPREHIIQLVETFATCVTLATSVEAAARWGAQLSVAQFCLRQAEPAGADAMY
jgi:hypothetical protein